MSRIRLLPHHRALIDASAISEQVARERGYVSILKAGDLNGMFGPSQRRAPALLIRLYNVHGEHFSQQLRPDELRTGKDGKLLKHETPAGLKMALDVPPSVRGQLRNPANPLWVTEGIRKVDAPAAARSRTGEEAEESAGSSRRSHTSVFERRDQKSETSSRKTSLTARGSAVRCIQEGPGPGQWPQRAASCHPVNPIYFSAAA